MQAETEAVIKELLKSLRKAAKGKEIIYVKTKTKNTQTVYDEDLKKPIQEIITETEEIEPRDAGLDMGMLKTISGILKELKDIQTPVHSGGEQGGVVILAGNHAEQDHGE